MPNNPLFSTYSTGENRLTSSTMAVFERIDLALVREILSAATGSGDELRAVTFENQVAPEVSRTIPDARISGRFTWWFEAKRVRGAYDAPGHGQDQLLDHAALLKDDLDGLLFVLTPDPAPPMFFNGLGGAVQSDVVERILWLSYRRLATAIEEITGDPARLVGEQTRFLLSELVQLYEMEGLLTNDDTVIVAARSAWPEYLQTGVYICQPERPFRDGLTHLGFYAGGAIQRLVPRILAHHRSVSLTMEEATHRRADGEQRLAEQIEAALDKGNRTEGAAYDVVLLSGPDDRPDTVELDEPIQNDTKTASGKPWAWTLNQRYTSLEKLRSGVRYTSEL